MMSYSQWIDHTVIVWHPYCFSTTYELLGHASMLHNVEWSNCALFLNLRGQPPVKCYINLAGVSPAHSGWRDFSSCCYCKSFNQLQFNETIHVWVQGKTPWLSCVGTSNLEEMVDVAFDSWMSNLGRCGHAYPCVRQHWCIYIKI